MFKDLIAENKIENILVFGDSHLAGCELHPDGTFKDYPSATWPNLLAEKLNITIHNYSLTGGSNDRSLRLLAEAVLSHKNSYVIYGLTDWLRGELYKHPKYIPVGICWKNTSMEKKHKEINDFYLENLLIDRIDAVYHNNYDVLNHLLYVQSICKLHAVDYSIIPLADSVLHMPNDSKQRVIFDALDKNKIFSFNKNLKNNNWMNWCKVNNFPKKNFHYSNRAHEVFADLFFNNSEKV